MSRIIARIRGPREATFKGAHNASKCKTLLLLYHRKHKLGLGTGLSARDIHLQSGVGYDYLRARLGVWFKWGYLSRRLTINYTGKPAFSYTIAKRGEHFIENRVPQEALDRYIAEIRIFRSQIANN